ncbi:hypothetical protein SteCoe_29788 [Stentor coeruleus]|uniref:Uncharacterized protein n=1 Tax=Stentor coeruleus TaxID=5963 RepID=A0A1R2B5G1_9CILI|nr:hypothetical protein SteCoe_29788 [Stentor coeruleus]
MEKIGLTTSSSKIWKMQRDANNKIRLKTAKSPIEDEKGYDEIMLRLESSHEIVLKYVKYIEERLMTIHKLYGKAYALVDSTPMSPMKIPAKIEELEIIKFKDMNRYKEMEVIELKVLDQFASRHVHKETDFLVIIERIKDKLSYYDHSLIALEQQIDAIQLQHQSKESEMQAKLQEITIKCDLQMAEFEKYRGAKLESSEYTENLKEENRILSYQISHLKNTIDELAHNEKIISEKYTNEIARLQEEISNYKRILKTQDNNENLLDECEYFKSAHKKLTEILSSIREITQNVFIKYGSIQSEWNDPHWKSEIDNCKGEYGEMLIEIEFLCYMIVKLTSDNNWLVDRLAELGREIHKLRKDGRSITPNKVKEEVISDLKAASNALKESASNALKEFEEARNKLMSQFS